MHVTTVTTCSHLHALPQGRTYCKKCDPLISRLPTELLIEIFHRCLDTSLNRTDIAPIILSGVCGAWRRICISTATLWSSLAIYNPRWKVIPLVRMCLKRADSCPLRILIHESGKLSGERQATVNIILRMLIDRCHLWKYIDFRFRDFQEALANIPVGSLKALKHASVSMPSYAWTTNDKDKVWDIVHSSPNLESIHYGKSYEKFQVHTPWAQLKIIHCGFSVPIQQLLHSLHYCRNLEVLTVMKGFISTEDHIIHPAKSIELPRLRSLEVSYFDKRFSIFFDALVSPQLTSLKIHYSHTWDDSLRCGNLSNLKNFAAHSGFTLRSFGLQDPKLEVEELLEWLEAPFLSMVTDLQVGIKPWHCQNIVYPRFPDVHPSYMESVAARLRMTISRSADEGSE